MKIIIQINRYAAWRRLPNGNLNIRTKLHGIFCQTAVTYWADYQYELKNKKNELRCLFNYEGATN